MDSQQRWSECLHDMCKMILDLPTVHVKCFKSKICYIVFKILGWCNSISQETNKVQSLTVRKHIFFLLKYWMPPFICHKNSWEKKITTFNVSEHISLTKMSCELKATTRLFWQYFPFLDVFFFFYWRNTSKRITHKEKKSSIVRVQFLLKKKKKNHSTLSWIRNVWVSMKKKALSEVKVWESIENPYFWIPATK